MVAPHLLVPRIILVFIFFVFGCGDAHQEPVHRRRCVVRIKLVVVWLLVFFVIVIVSVHLCSSSSDSLFIFSNGIGSRMRSCRCSTFRFLKLRFFFFGSTSRSLACSCYAYNLLRTQLQPCPVQTIVTAFGWAQVVEAARANVHVPLRTLFKLLLCAQRTQHLLAERTPTPST